MASPTLSFVQSAVFRSWNCEMHWPLPSGDRRETERLVLYTKLRARCDSVIIVSQFGIFIKSSVAHTGGESAKTVPLRHSTVDLRHHLLLPWWEQWRNRLGSEHTSWWDNAQMAVAEKANASSIAKIALTRNSSKSR